MPQHRVTVSPRPLQVFPPSPIPQRGYNDGQIHPANSNRLTLPAGYPTGRNLTSTPNRHTMSAEYQAEFLPPDHNRFTMSEAPNHRRQRSLPGQQPHYSLQEQPFKLPPPSRSATSTPVRTSSIVPSVPSSPIHPGASKARSPFPRPPRISARQTPAQTFADMGIVSKTQSDENCMIM